MKKQVLFLLIIFALVSGCKKNEAKRIPVNATYVLKGDVATFYENGLAEYTGNSLIIVSGKTGSDYFWSANNDTLFKDLWTGDKISISAHSYSSIFYYNGTTGQYLVDSGANPQSSVTVQ